jgi:hypothetical protein
MMAYTLVLYVVINGSVQVSKIKQADEFTCTLNAITFMMTKADGDKWKPLHAECVVKEKKPPKAKAPAAIDFKRMT